MTHQRYTRLFAGAIALSLVAAACGGDDDDSAAEPADDAEESADEPADDMDEPADEPADGEMADLASVCPSPLIIQTDWFPEAEHGTLYEMVGDDYEVDADNLIVTGSLVTDGGTVDTGIDIEVRSGGPALGDSTVGAVVYADESIHLAYQNTEAQVIQWESTPLQSVVAPLEKNPQMIMWDPETYPEIESIADIGEQGVTVQVFAGGTFSDVFVAQGLWSEDQVDASYNGSPAVFVAEGGAVAQQGFASAEPYTYEFEVDEWGKPIAFELLHDAGFEVYSQTIAVPPYHMEMLEPCLEQVVPIIQQATIDYGSDPARANAIIVDTVETFASFWVYTDGLAEFGASKMVELGLTGNGPDDTIGNMEEDRVQGVIDTIRDAGIEVQEDLVASDLFTNDYIDESIGF